MRTARPVISGWASSSTAKSKSPAMMRRSPISCGRRRLRPVRIAQNGTFEVTSAKRAQLLPSARRFLRSISAVPPNASAASEPKNSSEARSPFGGTWRERPEAEPPQHRVARHPQDAGRRIVLSRGALHPDRGRIGRGIAGDRQNGGERHDDERDQGEPRQERPEPDLRRVRIGRHEPREGRERDAGVQREKAALAELIAQIPAQPRAGEHDMAAVEGKTRDDERSERTGHPLECRGTVPPSSTGCAARDEPLGSGRRIGSPDKRRNRCLENRQKPGGIAGDV